MSTSSRRFAVVRLDAAHIIDDGSALLLGEGTFDLVVADWVFEHLRDAASAISEIDRVLRPGGWLCALTTNARGDIAPGSRIIPRRRHASGLRRFQPRRAPESVFARAL